jgi:Flp pilus assembly protein TadG
MMTPLRAITNIFGALSRRLRSDQRGNVLMITAGAIFVLSFATGMGVDYSRAMRLQTKLNAAADAAALAGVTQPMMIDTKYTDVQNTVSNMFKTQIANLPGLVWDDKNLTITIVGNTDKDPLQSLTQQRTVTVSYTAKSTNAFAGILNMATLAIHGSSTSTATAAPNIDFYLALDTSPSMALPTTSAGLAQMDSKMGCTFACHSNKIENYAGGASMPKGMIIGSQTNNPYNINYVLSGISVNASNGQMMYKIDSKGSYVYLNTPASKTITDTTTRKKCADANGYDVCVYNADGTFVDSYWYALNQGISLRVTAERDAVGDLMSLAKSYATQNKRTYRAALYTFDYGMSPYNNVKKLWPTSGTVDSNLDNITAASSGVDVVTVNDRANNGCPPGPTTCNSNQYLFTSFQSVMNKMTTDMPLLPGNGTNLLGDTPQAYLFLVTDGMSDEDIGSGRTRAPMQQAQVDQCTALKKRGIKIAILYTEYTVASIQDDEPNQRAIATTAITSSPTIAQRLTSCASSADLMYTVSNDQDISTALQTLFTRAIATARLTK